MNSKFSFYEVVQIKAGRPALQAIDGATGAVLGMAQNDDGSWVYSVHILDQEESWSVNESELLATGRFMKREDFYGGEALFVEVDAETGEGRAKGSS